MHIKPHCIFQACQMAFGEQLALVSAPYSYLCTELQVAAFLVRLGFSMNRYFQPIYFMHGTYTTVLVSTSWVLQKMTTLS